MPSIALQIENIRAALREFERTLKTINYLSVTFSDFESARNYYEKRVEEMKNQLKEVSK